MSHLLIRKHATGLIIDKQHDQYAIRLDDGILLTTTQRLRDARFLCDELGKIFPEWPDNQDDAIAMLDALGPLRNEVSNYIRGGVTRRDAGTVRNQTWDEFLDGRRQHYRSCNLQPPF